MRNKKKKEHSQPFCSIYGMKTHCFFHSNWSKRKYFLQQWIWVGTTPNKSRWWQTFNLPEGNTIWSDHSIGATIIEILDIELMQKKRKKEMQERAWNTHTKRRINGEKQRKTTQIIKSNQLQTIESAYIWYIYTLFQYRLMLSWSSCCLTLGHYSYLIK